jgi:hypothetical protein
VPRLARTTLHLPAARRCTALPNWPFKSSHSSTGGGPLQLRGAPSVGLAPGISSLRHWQRLVSTGIGPVSAPLLVPFVMAMPTTGALAVARLPFCLIAPEGTFANRRRIRSRCCNQSSGTWSGSCSASRAGRCAAPGFSLLIPKIKSNNWQGR